MLPDNGSLVCRFHILHFPFHFVINIFITAKMKVQEGIVVPLKEFQIKQHLKNIIPLIYEIKRSYSKIGVLAYYY